MNALEVDLVMARRNWTWSLSHTILLSKRSTSENRAGLMRTSSGTITGMEMDMGTEIITGTTEDGDGNGADWGVIEWGGEKRRGVYKYYKY